jgi:molybdopterin-guanine dinucleotide biosynthesis protein A
MVDSPDSALASAEVQAFILAGGASRRMGRDKASLPLHGEPMALALARRLAPHVAAVWLVAKRDSALEFLGLPLLYDASPERALVHGIQTALRAPGPPWRFLVACDMPDIGAGALDGLWHAARATGAPGSCARRWDRSDIDPLPSLWHADIAHAVRPEWGMTARDWVRRAGLACWSLPPSEAAHFANLNAPEDWERYLGPGSPSTVQP